MALQTCSQVPLYNSEGDFEGWATPARLANLAAGGSLRVVRDRKGEVRRAYRLPPAGRARTIDRPEMPPRYSGFRRVDDRDRVMSLLPLTGGYPHVKNLAPDYLRPIFIRVLLDCMGYGDPV